MAALVGNNGNDNDEVDDADDEEEVASSEFTQLSNTDYTLML